MPNRTKDVPGFIYTGRDDREGMVCRIIRQVDNLDILADVGPCFSVKYADGYVQTVVPAALLQPWFPV